ncbi:hypothetical protein [Pseudomonas sp. ACM7]|uniref:hypothetical protein n=1 Tax=Pseudomonas sp. ACM7 TaxID=2052956 RepID=UPI001012D3B8|nr:hypothetical protein [Pseudomonas sp. ACM7]
MDKNKTISNFFSLVQKKFWLAFLFFLAIIACIYSIYPPIWETNDDIAMSMVAHGYGLVTTGSPNIIFSNVLWGGIVRLIPSINGVLGYSVATVGVLALTGTAFLYFLSRAGAGVLCIAAVLILVMFRPLLFPQFTVNSGLLSVAAVLCWYSFGNNRSISACVAAFVFSSCAYLIRSQEFILVILVALPLLPLRKMYEDRVCRSTILILFFALASFSIIDRQAYQNESWKAFNDFNPVRAKFTDFRAGPTLKLRTDVLEQNNYSANDVDLVSNWFFADPNIANTKVLASMLSQIGFFPDESIVASNILAGIEALWHPKLAALTLTALILAAFCPSRRLILSWVLFVSAISLLGLLGRPAILRVYVPILCLLVLSPLLFSRLHGWRQFFVGIILFAGAIVNSYFVAADSSNATSGSKKQLAELAAFPTDPLVVWGSEFPYESLYPVLGGKELVSMDFKIYVLGVFTLAPFSLASMEQQQARGFDKLITTTNGIKIVGAKMLLLEGYCREHFSSSLMELGRKTYGSVQVAQIRCGN